MVVLSDAEPRVRSSTRTAPFTLLAVTLPPAWPISTAPLAAFTRTSLVTAPTQVSPFEFLITADPSTWLTRTRPDPVVISA